MLYVVLFTVVDVVKYLNKCVNNRLFILILYLIVLEYKASVFPSK